MCVGNEFMCVQDLETRLGRYQEKSDRLQVENTELQGKLRQQVEDQEQMITFLKQKSSEQAELFVDLEEQLAAIQQVYTQYMYVRKRGVYVYVYSY